MDTLEQAESLSGPSTRGTPTSPPPPTPPPAPLTMSAEDLFAGDTDMSVSAIAGPSRTPTPTPAKNAPAPKKPAKSKKPARPVQLISELPVALEEACKTFEVLKESRYQSKKLGASQELLEGSMCDCAFIPGKDDPEDACGERSDCINRLTQVECDPRECKCRRFCKNQRFQKREYAHITVVQTEKKGFGLRAEEDIPRDGFIMEYVGDVVNEKSFKKRLHDYAAKGIKHFYFMMLQKGAYIDATAAGGIGRFANHSCAPNCYVAKWTVPSSSSSSPSLVRMGIFAKRSIANGEELTFDYNVDRYGFEAQKCWCGEPECVGFIGGKTQTVSDDTLAALGIDLEDVDQPELQLKLKKRKGKGLGLGKLEVLSPLEVRDVPKVLQAIRANVGSAEVLGKLLRRVQMTEDMAVLRQVMRLRALTLFKTLLEDALGIVAPPEEEEEQAKEAEATSTPNSESPRESTTGPESTPPPQTQVDRDMAVLIMQCLTTWPLVQRNKVLDSKILDTLDACIAKAPAESEDEGKCATMAGELKTKWEALEIAYRIPKRKIDPTLTIEDHPAAGQEDSLDDVSVPAPEPKPVEKPEPTPKRPRMDERRKARPRPSFRPLTPPPPPPPPLKPSASWTASLPSSSQSKLDKYKQEAERRLEEESRAKEEAQAKQAQKDLERKERRQKEIERKERRERKEKKKKEWEEQKARRMRKLVGVLVMEVMNKYAGGRVDRERFKRYAKELTHMIATKEQKSPKYATCKYDAPFEGEKAKKVKTFAKEYIAKILKRLKQEGKLQEGKSHAAKDKQDMTLEETFDLEAGHEEKDREKPEDQEEQEGDMELSDEEEDAEDVYPETKPPEEETRRNGDGEEHGEQDPMVEGEDPMDVDPPSYEVAMGQKSVVELGAS